MPHHATSCHIMPHHATSCHIMSHLAASCHIMPHHTKLQLPTWTMNIWPECLKLQISGNLVTCLRHGFLCHFVHSALQQQSPSPTHKQPPVTPQAWNSAFLSRYFWIMLTFPLMMWHSALDTKCFACHLEIILLWIFTNPQIIRSENFHIYFFCMFVAAVRTDSPLCK